MRKMLKFVIKKILVTVITIFLILLFSFFLFYLMPGDPITLLLLGGKQRPGHGFSEDMLNQIKAFYGLDKPPHLQFLTYVSNFLTGKWGISVTLYKGVPIGDFIGYRLLNTLFLCGVATLISAYVGIKIGVFSAWRRGKKADVGLTGLSLVLYSVPAFWLGIVLLLIFAIMIPIFPLGRVSSYQGSDLLMIIGDRVYHLILPVATYVLGAFAGFSLIMRSSLTDILTEDYIITAKAKGLTRKGIQKEHAMPNAMLSMITVIAYEFGWVLMGSIVVESVFSYPGLGLLTYEAAIGRDFPVLMVIFFITSIGMVLANAIADVLYAHFDPRVEM